MSEIRKLGKHTSIYALGTLLSKLTGFIMLPVYTHLLTPSDYGTLELLSVTIDVIGMLTGVGIAVSVFRFRAEYEDEREKSAVMSTAAIALTAIALLTAAAGFLLSAPLTHLVLKGAGRAVYFQIFFLTYLAQSVETVPLLQLRAEERSATFVVVSLAKLLATVGLNIYFVAYRHTGVAGVLASNLIVTSLSALILGSRMFMRTGMRFDRDKLVRMMQYGYPMVFVFLGNFVLVFSDRYFLQQFSNTSEVGIYSLAYRFAFMLSAFIATPFQQVWAPQRFVIAKQADAPRRFAAVFTYLNLGLAAAALGFVLFAGDVLRVMAGPKFWGAAAVVPLLVSAQVLWCWCDYVNVGFLVRQRTSEFAKASVLGVVATLGLNFLLIPRYGMWGAATATFVAYGIRFVTIYVMGQRKYPIPFEWARVGRLYAIALAAGFTRAAAGRLPIAASVGLGLTLALLTALATYAVVLNAREREAVRALLRRPRQLLALAVLRK